MIVQALTKTSRQFSTIQVVILRHGQSECNQRKIWSGWSDAKLSPKGQLDAIECGRILKLEGFEFDRVYCSRLTRSIKTLNFILNEMDCLYIPISKCWQLNQKFYGALQGVEKLKMVDIYGKNMVSLWRRSFTIPPPQMPKDDPRHPVHDPKYKDIDPALLPSSENMSDVLKRVRVLYQREIRLKLIQKERLLIVCHGSTVRAFSNILMGLSQDQACKFEIPNATPLVIQLNDDLSFKESRILGDAAQISKKTKIVRDELLRK